MQPAPLYRRPFSTRGLARQVMSQQTQVARVVEYHKRWVARWPTVQVGPTTLHRLCISGVIEGCVCRHADNGPKVCFTLAFGGHAPPSSIQTSHILSAQALAEATRDEVNALWAGEVITGSAPPPCRAGRSVLCSHARTLAATRPAVSCQLHAHTRLGPCAAPARCRPRPDMSAYPAGRELRGRQRAGRARQAQAGRRRRPGVLPARRVPAGRGAPRGGALRRRPAHHHERAAAHPRCGLGAAARGRAPEAAAF